MAAVAIVLSLGLALLVSDPVRAGEAPLQGTIGQPGAANVKAEPYGAFGDGVHDDTRAIQRAIDTSTVVFLPKGVYRINPRTGLSIRLGTQILGEGRTASILLAGIGGGSMEELARYSAGSIIHRAFDASAANSTVAFVRLADFAVILSHPRDRITSTAIQIGIDLRNVSRSLVERVHVGNVPPVGSAVSKAPAHTFDSQGFGIVIGTRSSSDPAYAGGEVNTIRDVSVWGAYKAIVQDDPVLSPMSAAHATVVERADLQGAEYLLSQNGRYTRGVVWRDNVLQNLVPRNDRAGSGAAFEVSGADVNIDGGYVELGPLGKRLAELTKESRNVTFAPSYVDCTGKPKIYDMGSENRVASSTTC